MYKPKKPDEQANLSKIKLNTQSSMPSSSQVKDMLTEAQGKKGVSIEQPWTTSQGGQSFILIVRWGPTDSTPIWTLYEESAGQSKMHWSQPFEPNDFSMMYDVIVMSAPDAGSGIKIPDALRPEKPSGSSGSGGMPPKPSAGPDLFPGGAAPPAMPYPGGAQAPYQQGGSGFPPFPQGGGPAPYPAPGGYPSPAPYPPQNPQQAPYNSPPAQWQGQGQPGYPPPQPAPGYAPASSSYPSSNPSFTPAAQISPADSPKIPIVDYGLMSQRANILLGELLFEAELITEPSLEAALKIQEYVREERMSPGQAGEVLKRHHSLGGSIDNYLTPEDFDLDASRGSTRPKQSYNSALASASAAQQAAKTGSPGTKSGGTGKPGAPGGVSADSGKSDKARLQLAAMDLLQKAGILKADDVQLAHGVYKKVGGDLPQILTSAGKLDGSTYKAAEICIHLVKEGKMKVEQCIIALNYCSRSRVDFDSAMDELGWENPRKKK